MTWPTQEKPAVLIHGDSGPLLDELPDACIDAAIFDPPFGTTAAAWDVGIALGVLWSRLKRVVRPAGAIVVTAAEPFASRLVTCFAAGVGRTFRHDLIWESPNGTAGGAVRDGRRMAPLKCHTHVKVFTPHGRGLAYYEPQKTRGEPYNARGTWAARDVGDTLAGSTAHGGKRRAHTRNATGARWPRSVVRLPHDARQGWNPDEGRHKVPGGPSTQKPQSLMRYLVQAYCPPGGLVLDPFAGSAATLVAARAEGRRAIGFEIDETHYRAACAAWGLGPGA